MAVARHRHFTRAADELYLTQSAVSQQVRRLEAELGVELFVRGGEVSMTPAGEELLPRAREILRGLDDARAAVTGAAVGSVRVFAEHPAGLAAAVAAFHREHPAVRVSFEGGDVYAGGAAPAGWDVVHRHTEPLVILGDAGARLRSLKGRTMILAGRADPLRRAVDAACATAGFGPVPVLEVSDVAAVRALVDLGAGVALVPLSWAPDGVPLEEPVRYETVVAVRPGAPPAAHALAVQITVVSRDA